MARPVRPEIAAAREAEQEYEQPPRPSSEVVVLPVREQAAEVYVPAEPEPDHEPEQDMAEVALSAPSTGPDTVWWERALIGSVLKAQGQGSVDLSGLVRTVGPADFHETAHEAIWDAVLRLWDDGVWPTVTAVMGRMGMAAHRALPGGPLYLHELAAAEDYHPVQAQQYADAVKECAMKRQIHSLGLRAQQIVADTESTSEQFLTGLTSWLDRVSAASRPSETGLASALEQVIETAQNGQRLALETGWRDLDDLLGGGLYPGQLVVVGARPGVGKTIMLENIGTHIARMPDCEALFVSLEMTQVELVTRTLAWTATVPLNALRSGGAELTEQHWEKIARAQQKITDTHMTVVDASDQTVRGIRMEARRAAMVARRSGRRLAVICVDYAGLITGSNPRQDERQVINEASRELKKLAKELHCTVVLAAQLNRKGVDRKNPQPLLTDLKESGSLEQDADVVMLLHEVEVESEPGGPMLKTGDVQVLVPKQRNGPTGVRTLKKWGHYQCFRAIA